jgi:hypothetical protein
LPRRRKIAAKILREVRQRANSLCEYCHASEQWQYVPFTADHVIPINLGGDDTTNNLALACFHCNRRKTDRLTGIDPVSKQEVPLFNPRQHAWSEHFIWSADAQRIVGLTQIGRATVQALELNRERALPIRAADVVAGRHPPPNDPIQH